MEEKPEPFEPCCKGKYQPCLFSVCRIKTPHCICGERLQHEFHQNLRDVAGAED